MDRTPIFRDAALKQLTSPDQLDQLIQVVPQRGWLITGVLYLLLVALFIWLIFGNIPTRAEGVGILLAGGGDIYQAVAADGPSYVVRILVKPGDNVQAGQVVAILARPDLINQIKVAQQEIADLSAKYAELTNLSTVQIAQRQQELDKQREVLKIDLANNQIKLKSSAEMLAIKQGALKKGVETRQSVEQTFQEYYSVKNQVDGYNDQLAQLAIAQNNFQNEWQERLRQLALKITDEKSNLANLQARNALSTRVISPVMGKVIDIQSKLGSIVNTGATVVSVANQGKGLDALVYLPPETGKRVKAGMETLVAPNVVEKAEYGSIYAKVISVAPFPASSAVMEAALHNPELAKKFTGQETPIEIRVQLENDPNTFSGLKWSSSSGPNQLITPGTLVSARVTVRNQRPITLIIPMFKKLVGSV